MSSTIAGGKSNTSLDVAPNAHHIIREALPLIRGESLMEYVVSLNLNILNQSNELTFVIHNRNKVTALY
jgi:hypothetical protein